MERNFKRISDQLKLPRESRERIRSQLASHQAEQEVIPMKKVNLKRRVPLVAAVIVLAMALTITASAAVAHLFRNDIIVPSKDDIAAFSDASSGTDATVAVVAPNGTPPFPLEEIINSARLKSDDWEVGEWINDGLPLEYSRWDFAEVLSNDPALRSRRVSREDGSKKMEYTAENPANLLDTLTGRVTLDLSWMDSQYDYVPDANLSYVVTDADGNYVGETFNALYAKPDGSGYVSIELYNVAPADYFGQNYIIDGSYETAYYYTTPDGYEFIIEMNTGNVWAECRTGHAAVSLYGAYLTSEEVESILDNLSLSISEQ